MGKYYQTLVPSAADAPTRWIKEDPLLQYFGQTAADGATPYDGVWSGCKPAITASGYVFSNLYSNFWLIFGKL